MSDPRSRANELRSEAEDLPYCPSKVALLEEAVQLADSVNDLELAYEIREELMTAATFSGRPDIMLVAFSWCLAEYDRNPERFDRDDILWKYKWVLGDVFQFPEISRARMEEILIDMERRFREAGSTMHAVQLERRTLMVLLGEREQARLAHAELRRCRRDSLSDCPACVAYANCGYYCFLGQWGRVVQSAQPVLKGHLSCTEEPHRTLSRVLVPLLHLDRLDEAKAYQRQGYRLVGGPQFIRQHSEHIAFLALVGELAQAKSLFERHLPGAMETKETSQRFDFFLAGRLWIDCLARRGTRRLKLRLPQGLPLSAADGKLDLRLLGDWFTAQAQEIAKRFDSRNGTSEFQRGIDELPELLRLAVD